MVEDIKDLPEEQWLHTFNINIHSFFYCAKYALPHMKEGATVINNASINAYIGRPDLLDYTSTKGAIVSFTRGLSNQYVSKGIRVNAVAPGPGKTKATIRVDNSADLVISVDTSYPLDDERRSSKELYQSDGSTSSAVRDCDLCCIPGHD